VSHMTIGELARRTGLAVRTLRFYADAGVLPEAARSESGYRLFGPDAVARARLLRTLRELGVGLADIKRVLAAEVSLAEISDRHARALDAQIRTLRLRRAVLRAAATSTNAEELQRMTDLTSMTADERRRILDDYLDAVFGDEESPVAERLRTGAPELPEDPSADQVAAWVELVELLRDPDYIESSRRMAERARSDGVAPDGGHGAVAAIEEQARAAVAAGIAPDSPEALAVIEHVEALTPGGAGNRLGVADRMGVAERLETFTDRRVYRYWTLVGIVNGWPQARTTGVVQLTEAWEWYATALRAHA
jgi:DNA-binding transcriptional MerR regulator